MRDCLERQNSKNKTVRRAKGFREQKKFQNESWLGDSVFELQQLEELEELGIRLSGKCVKITI